MHSAGLELTKLTYTRLEDNLVHHRGDRLSSAPQYSRERGPSRPGGGGTAASTSCPCPTGLGGDGCRAFGGGGDIVVWGG